MSRTQGSITKSQMLQLSLGPSPLADCFMVEMIFFPPRSLMIGGTRVRTFCFLHLILARM